MTPKFNDELYDKLSSRKCTRNDISTFLLIEQEELKVLIDEKLIDNDDLRYVFDKISTHDHATYLVASEERLFNLLLSKDIITAKELIDKLKSKAALANFLKLNWSSTAMQRLLRKQKVQDTDISLLIDSITKPYELSQLSKNFVLFRRILTNNIRSFKELVDLYKHTADSQNRPCLRNLFSFCENQKNFSALIRTNQISDQDLSYLMSSIDSVREVDSLFSKPGCLIVQHLLDSKMYSCSDLLKFCKEHNALQVFVGWRNQVRNKIFHEKLLTDEDLTFLWNNLHTQREVQDSSIEWLCIYKHAVNNNIATVKDVINKISAAQKYDHPYTLERMIQDKTILEDWFAEGKMTVSDIQHLVKKVKSARFFKEIAQNTFLMNQILKNYMLTDKVIEKLGADVFSIIRKTLQGLKEVDKERIAKLQKLLNVNEELYTFKLSRSSLTVDEQLEVLSIVSESDRAESLLKQIIENNLLHQYDFLSLKDVITKDDRKKRQKLNF